ncbi:hypothetical protein BUE80_DR013571 [Diplocarpon rosae]|nr:hypothetical protein BUE80_DR013571 [Diplocarpon rosae]
MASFPLEGHDPSHIKRADIIEAIKIAPSIRSFEAGPSLARITRSTIVKYGRHVHLHEARNMQYISQNTNILLPAVLDFWEEDDKSPYDESNTCYIIMQYIGGRLVSDIWENLETEARSGILRQLSEHIDELHTLKMDCPGPIGGGISEGSFFTEYGAGPFNSTQDMEGWFNDRLLVCHNFRRTRHVPPGWFTGRFGELVMCHLDIHPRNLILDDQGNLWLLDWACSGAYPPYFETANIIWRGTKELKSELLVLMGTSTRLEKIDKLLAIGFALTTGAYSQPKRKSGSICDAWPRVLTLNLSRVFTLAQLLTPLLEAADGEASPARVINIGSVDGLRVPTRDTFAYSASKAGLHHLSRVMANHLGKRNITSNTIACGPFESKMMAETLKNLKESIVSTIPLGRIGTPQDVFVLEWKGWRL